VCVCVCVCVCVRVSVCPSVADTNSSENKERSFKFYSSFRKITRRAVPDIKIRVTTLQSATQRRTSPVTPSSLSRFPSPSAASIFGTTDDYQTPELSSPAKCQRYLRHDTSAHSLRRTCPATHTKMRHADTLRLRLAHPKM
jgi:DsbC/DsbD-like thiol-disulfide interchange protein